MARSLLDTVDKLIEIIPADQPVVEALESWRSNVFLILPEDESAQWRHVGTILLRHCPFVAIEEYDETWLQIIEVWNPTKAIGPNV